jgi:hypothetical protein
MIVGYQEMVGLVATSAPGCPTPMIMDALSRSGFEFCQKSSAWQFISDPQSVRANTHTYEIETPSGTVVTELITVTYAGVPLTPKTTSDLDNIFQGWHTATGTPAYYFRPTDGEVRLVATPAATQLKVLVTTVAVAPKIIGGAGIDSDVFNKYQEALISGALYRLLMMPKKDWTDAGLAQFHEARYRSGIGQARVVALAANSTAELRVRAPRFA